MITALLYRCPVCGKFDWFADNQCVSCGAEVDASSRTQISLNGQRESIAYWYDRVYSFALPAALYTEMPHDGKALGNPGCEPDLRVGSGGLKGREGTAQGEALGKADHTASPGTV